MKTIRRDWLKKQVEALKMEARCDLYIEHDGNGSYDTRGGPWMPARIQHPIYQKCMTLGGFEGEVCINRDFADGWVNLADHHFTGNCGRAWRDENGVITLHVHSNLCYSLRFKAAPEREEEA